MPEQLRLLVTLFAALEFGLNSLSLYQHTPDFEAVKRAVEGSSQRLVYTRITASLPSIFLLWL